MFLNRLFLCTCLTSLAALQPAIAHAQDAPRPALKPRVEANLRAGTERSIAMSEFWVPLAQDAVQGSVLYGDARFMGDDKENNEFNLGVGYREIVTDVPVLGNGVAGVHGWVDRRHTERGAAFNQITAGAEWHGEVFDIKANAYIPLNKSKTHAAGTTTTAPYLAGSGIFYDITNMKLIEEAQPGFDLELGLNVSGIVDGFADSARVYAGAYHFAGDKSDDVTGWRTRVASDITQDVQLGARFQRDDERGSQGFLEATIRFPFGNKQSYKQHGLYARLDESPERDIDIVTSATRPTPASAPVVTPVLNATSGDAQRVLYVDNTAGAGGTGTLNNPFNSLADAQADLRDNDVVYVARGDGLTTNMNTGFTINRAGVSLIGEGSAFVYDGGKFTAADANFSGTVLKAAGLAPFISNTAGAGLTITADNAQIFGLHIDAATGDGIIVRNALNSSFNNISSTGNDGRGLFVEATGAANTSLRMAHSVITGNRLQGIEFDDESTGSITADLGHAGAAGGNHIFGNIGAEIDIDLDGDILNALGNWWGGGALTDTAGTDAGIINGGNVMAAATCPSCTMQAFAFVDNNNANAQRAVASNDIIFGGFTGTRYIAASGEGTPEIVLNDIASGNAVMRITDGDKVAVQMTSAPNLTQSRTANLMAGQSSDSFTVTAFNFLSAMNGLTLWMDANDLNGDFDFTDNPADGATITQWFDKSGMGDIANRHASDATPIIYRTTGGIGGQAAVDLDGVNVPGVSYDNSMVFQSLHTRLRILSGVDSGFTVFQVINVDANSPDNSSSGILSSWAIGNHINANRLAFGGRNGNRFTLNTAGASGAGNSITGSGPLLDQDIIYTTTYRSNGVDNLGRDVWTNGAATNSQTIATANPIAVDYPVGGGPVIIGARHPGNDNYADIKFSEIIVFDRVLNAGERAQVEQYLSGKYGIVLPP